MRVSMLESGIRDVRKALNLYARKDKSFAERLVYNNGVHGDISMKVIVENLGCDIFDKQGKMTEDGYETVKEIIKNNRLQNDADWYQAIMVSHKNWLASPNPSTKNKYTVFDYMESPDCLAYGRVVVKKKR